MKRNGFTLIELAIALMVIGLLIGGVLKGQELIQNARITAFVKQYNDFDTAITIFQSTYGAIPGDMRRPERLPNCTSALCNAPGNGNGIISNGEGTPAGVEVYNFFPHLTKAGMLKGPEGGTAAQMSAHVADPNPGTSPTYEVFFPVMPIGYLFYPDDNTPYIYAPLRDSARIDQKLDDGHPMTGRMRTEECPLIDRNSDGVTDDYDITQPNDGCGSWLGLNSLRPWWDM